MVEIIVTFLCLILTVFFIVVLSNLYRSNVETHPKRPSKEVVMAKAPESGIRYLDSYEASHKFEKRSHEAGSEPNVRRKTNQLNKSDDKRVESEDKGSESNNKGDKSADKGTESDDKGNESDDKGNESDDKGNGSDDKGDKSADKGTESDFKGDKSADKRNESDYKGDKSADKGNENDEADIIEFLSRDCFENDDSMEEEYKKFSSFVSEKDLKTEMKKSGTTHGLFDYVRKSLDHWKEREVLVAVTGNAGAGKSSLINALRKLRPSEKGAAKVGVDETTTEGQAYTYPNNKNVALWDLPGIGTQKFTRRKYLDDMNFSRFDVVIIVTAVRFFENDIWLANEIDKLGKHVLFVRTKIDIDMKNSKRDYPGQFCETEIMKRIKESIAEKLCDGGLKKIASSIYLVSSPKPGLYDFHTLNETIKSLLNIRGKAIRFFLQRYVEREIETKQESSKTANKFLRALGTLSVVLVGLKNGLSMIVGTDYYLCLSKFCLDDKSLDKFSEELSVPKDVIKKHLKTFSLLGSDDNVLLQATKKSRKKYNPFIDRWTFQLPLLNIFLYTPQGYKRSQECLETICNQMAEDEFRLTCLRLAKLEKELTPLKTEDI